MTYFRLLSFAILLASVSACSDDQFDDGIPRKFFDVTINLRNLAYKNLEVPGGNVFHPEGVRGIVIVRQAGDNYLVLERNCTFTPTEANAIVDLDVSTLFLIDHSCGSRFDLSGFSIKGPATIPLRTYFSKKTGSFLRISSDPI